MAATGAGKTEIQKNIVYANHDGAALQGDLYLPQGPGPFPALVTVHGGGWVRGARSQFQHWAPHLANCGYAVFNVTYRVAAAGRKMFPEAVQDVRAAVQFLRAGAGGYRIDPERIGLFGASAGAHLSALAALGHDAPLFSGGYPEDAHAGVSAKVKVLLGFYGIYDVAEMWRQFQVQSPSENNVPKLLGVTLPQDRRAYFDASPISYATVANNQTAVFLSVGTEDDFISRETQTDAFQLALKQAGFFVRGCVVPGAPHYYVSDPFNEATSFSDYVAPRLLRFLGERL